MKLGLAPQLSNWEQDPWRRSSAGPLTGLRAALVSRLTHARSMHYLYMICIPHTSKVTNKISYCAIMPCVCVFIAQMKYTTLHCTGKLIFWQIFECIEPDAFLMMAMFIFRQIQFKKTETEDCLEVNSVCCKNQDLSSFPARLSPGMWMSRDRGSGVCGQVIPPALSSIQHLQSLHTASVSGENIKKWTKSVAVAVVVAVGPHWTSGFTAPLMGEGWPGPVWGAWPGATLQSLQHIHAGTMWTRVIGGHTNCQPTFSKFHTAQRKLGPSPCWKSIPKFIQLRVYEDTMLIGHLNTISKVDEKSGGLSAKIINNGRF